MSILLWLLLAVLTIVPMLKLLPHFGINKLWALAGIFPIGTVALIWWMALKLQDLERR
jgi:hypothetical protein